MGAVKGNSRLTGGLPSVMLQMRLHKHGKDTNNSYPQLQQAELLPNTLHVFESPDIVAVQRAWMRTLVDPLAEPPNPESRGRDTYIYHHVRLVSLVISEHALAC